MKKQRRIHAAETRSPKRSAMASVAALLMVVLGVSGTLTSLGAGANEGCGEFNYGFTDTRLINDGISTSAGPFTVSLPAGTYDVTLKGFDDHGEASDPTQTGEQWYVMLDNGWQSPLTDDIPDDVDMVTTTFAGVTIEAATAISVHHAGEGNVNSLQVECVGFTPSGAGGDMAEGDDDSAVECTDPAVVEEPAEEEVVPAEEEVVPADEGVVPADEEVVPADEEVVPADEDEAVPAAEDEAVPAAEDEAVPAAEDEAVPAAEDDAAETSSDVRSLQVEDEPVEVDEAEAPVDDMVEAEEAEAPVDDMVEAEEAEAPVDDMVEAEEAEAPADEPVLCEENIADEAEAPAEDDAVIEESEEAPVEAVVEEDTEAPAEEVVAEEEDTEAPAEEVVAEEVVAEEAPAEEAPAEEAPAEEAPAEEAVASADEEIISEA